MDLNESLELLVQDHLDGTDRTKEIYALCTEEEGSFLCDVELKEILKRGVEDSYTVRTGDETSDDLWEFVFVEDVTYEILSARLDPEEAEQAKRLAMCDLGNYEEEDR